MLSRRSSAIAGNSAALRISSFATNINSAVGSSIGPFSIQNIGAKKARTCQKGQHLFAFLTAVTLRSALVTVFFLFGPQLLSIFVLEDPAAIAFKLLLIICYPSNTASTDTATASTESVAATPASPTPSDSKRWCI